MTFLAFEIG